MSEQARIETAIDTTIDNCEALRARLAKYEDADGKPITTIAEQAREISILRNIISECATACGAAVSAECSEEFMAMLPDEIRTVMAGKSREVERLGGGLEDVLFDWGQIRLELAALKAKPGGVVLPLMAALESVVHDERVPNEVSQEVAAVLIEARRLNQPASAGDERAAGTKVSDASINCWSCKLSVSLDERADADGNCPHCRVELDLEEYLRSALSDNHSEQVRHMVPDFYWVEADEGSWNSPEEWAQDYYDYNGEKPESVSFSCAVELPAREYDSFEFDGNGNCISCRLVAAPSAGSQKEQGE